MGETVERTLVREMSEETSVRLGDARLVFIEDAGAPYGIQYIYLIDYISGQPKLSPDSGEASLNKLGQNLHEPMWMPMKDLLDAPFVSERLKQVIMHAIKSGFPAKAETI
jgi:ADP-ribose pyrophosphatase YjhB (NUDIX family)